jgi:two-component system, NarL family, invasion response regulator UvrY
MKILLIDDHAVIRAGVSRLLADEIGASILEAESGKMALDIWRREKPDLIVLETNLSGSSGLELIRQLVQLNKSTRILILSMRSEPVYAARALEAGALGYVSKSAAVEELVEAVQQVGRGNRYIENEIALQIAVRTDPLHPLDDGERGIVLTADGNTEVAE